MIGARSDLAHSSRITGRAPFFFWNNMEYYYRYVDVLEFSLDDLFDSRPRIKLDKFEVIKHTKCGVWINLWGDKKKFILDNTHKKWACKTIEEAKISFIKRKEKQLDIYTNKLRHVNEFLSMAREGNFEELGS